MLPDHLKQRLHESGTQVWVGSRADETPGWAGLTEATGWTSTSKSPDGRSMGTLSFYYATRNELFISVDHPGGSVNVYTHELGHAIDYQLIPGIRLSEDPEWVQLHATSILNNPSIIDYYRTGSNGTAGSGRRELFAEGFAVFNEYGRGRLIEFVHNEVVADQMIAIWKRLGVIK